VRECGIELNDKTTIREMLTYIVTQTGGMEAESGCFDDTVMALALANHVCEGAWEPIEATDNYYIEMV
jgi:ADP-ribosylglycohydrolase